MPKLIDSYVLTHQIGKGQFGKVYRGYDRTTNNDVAVKVMERKNIVGRCMNDLGKLIEQLEREIKVLKACENPNIIRLYDIKKTSNNIYIILEYCNEGDLDQYLKKRKKFTEEQGLDFLSQILNGFKTLVQNKIMHRDFKLANVMKHNGEVKIGDFGFSKLLGDEEYTNTNLGSPLNMAPQILKGKQYNQKADIYSVGVTFYQMLFGKPPFNAANKQLLAQVIQKNDIPFPRQINKISQLTKKLIKSMLCFNPQHRIDWQQLFHHPALKQKQQEVQKMLQMSVGGSGGLMSNMSKFYLKNNLVILQVADILKKEEVNNFAFQMFKTNKVGNQFKGEYVKNEGKRKSQVNKKVRAVIKEGDNGFEEGETLEDRLEKIMKENTNFLLNQRNKYTFVLTIIQQLEQIEGLQSAKDLRYNIALQLKSKVQQFSTSIKSRKNQFSLPSWQLFLQCSAYSLLTHFFQKQYQIFTYQIQDVLKRSKKPTNTNIPQLVKVVAEECAKVLSGNKNDLNDEVYRIHWIRVDHVIDYLRLEEIMVGDEFDFKMYYNQNGRIELEELVQKVKKKMMKMK